MPIERSAAFSERTSPRPKRSTTAGRRRSVSSDGCPWSRAYTRKLSLTERNCSEALSWSTAAIDLRTAKPSRTGSNPATRTKPDVGASSVVRIRRDVVLPAPFGPRRPNRDPRGTSKESPSTARIAPVFPRNIRTRSRTTTGGEALTAGNLAARANVALARSEPAHASASGSPNPARPLAWFLARFRSRGARLLPSGDSSRRETNFAVPLLSGFGAASGRGSCDRLRRLRLGLRLCHGRRLLRFARLRLRLLFGLLGRLEEDLLHRRDVLGGGLEPAPRTVAGENRAGLALAQQEVRVVALRT